MKKNIDKIRRELMKIDGFFDGRFKKKIYVDRKKEKDRNACRDFKF